MDPKGIEPLTSTVQMSRSSQLSYGPIERNEFIKYLTNIIFQNSFLVASNLSRYILLSSRMAKQLTNGKLSYESVSDTPSVMVMDGQPLVEPSTGVEPKSSEY